ncbi:MAG TPA: CoA transferase, partial [Azonexus sp.]
EVLGRPEWIPRQWDAGLRGELAALFATRSRDHWTNLFAAVDCCVTPVLTPEEALGNAQIAARGMVRRVDGLTQFAPPLKLSDYQFDIRQAAPRAGEHSEEILRAAGYSVAQIDRLKAAGVLG